jgi:ribosome-associated translation inhibitor RaiA
MMIKLDWVHCVPRKKWEMQIHQLLEHFAAQKTISLASIRVEEQVGRGQRFRLGLMLSIPGPDVVVEAAGQTFDEALTKLNQAVQRWLGKRARKVRRNTDAPKGVKAQFRG